MTMMLTLNRWRHKLKLGGHVLWYLASIADVYRWYPLFRRRDLWFQWQCRYGVVHTLDATQRLVPDVSPGRRSSQ